MITYENIEPAVFISRPNRFIAHVELGGRMEICHVKTTGRCRELLIPGAEIYIQKAQNPARKTKYDLIAVQKGERLINIDSQIPNKVFARWLERGDFAGNITYIRPEVAFGGSRFDFYIEAGDRRIFAEVKGVTLEENEVALFPDAPTGRGIKHLDELCRCTREGYEAICAFIIQMKGVDCFAPNYKTHAAFGEALHRAAGCGVRLVALDCHVTPGSIAAADVVRIEL